MSLLLTEDEAQQALDLVKPAIDQAMAAGLLHRRDFHVVIMDPSLPFGTVPFPQAILAEYSSGDKDKWEHRYDEIAQSKADITWRTGLPTQVIMNVMPYVLEHGDTRYYGSVNLQGMIVAVSGFKPWLDEMVATWIAAACRAIAIGLFQTKVVPSDEAFLNDSLLSE